MDKESLSDASLNINLDAATLTALKSLAAERHETLEGLLRGLIAEALAPRSTGSRPIEGARVAGAVLSQNPAQLKLLENWLEQDGEDLLPSFSEVQRRLRFAGTPALGKNSAQKP